jgi:hypothetical protein
MNEGQRLRCLELAAALHDIKSRDVIPLAAEFERFIAGHDSAQLQIKSSQPQIRVNP